MERVYVDLWSKTLRFGKHFGKRLSEVDSGYLRWMLKTVEGMDRDEKKAVLNELAGRGAPPPPPPPPSGGPLKLPAGVTATAILEIVQAGRRALAKNHHPDLGGDATRMVAVNSTADYLENIARALQTQPGSAAR